MRRRFRGLVLTLALTIASGPAWAHGGASDQNSVSRGFRVDAAYLDGRWCDSTGAWTTFDSRTGQVDLPIGNTERRIIGTYRLDGDSLTFTGPAGIALTGTVRRIDAQSMSLNIGSRSDVLRRCRASPSVQPVARATGLGASRT